MAIGFSVKISVAAAAAAAMHIIVFRINILDRSAGHADSSAAISVSPSTVTTTSASTSAIVLSMPIIGWLTATSASGTAITGTTQPSSIIIFIVEVVERVVWVETIRHATIIVDAGDLIAIHKIERKWRWK